MVPLLTCCPCALAEVNHPVAYERNAKKAYTPGREVVATSPCDVQEVVDVRKTGHSRWLQDETENVSATDERWYDPGPVIFAKSLRAPRALLSVACLSLAFIGQLPAATRPAPPPSLEEDAQFEALPLVRTHQNHLLVHAFINEKPALLIVDTGSPGTVISSKRCGYFHVGRVSAESKLPARVQVNGSYNKLVMAHSLRLGGLNVADVPAVAVDLSGARHSARMMHELEADGILGADVLFATKAVLDCQRQLLILNLRPELPGTVQGVDFRGFQKMPIFVSEGFNLYVDGRVNGSPARLMIDTGAFTTLLHRGFVRQLHIPTEETRLQSAAINLKEEGVDVARIRKLSFGLVDILGKDVGVVDLGGVLHEGLQRNPPAVGLLGAEILKRNHGIIDFGTRILYLRAESSESIRRSRRQSRTVGAIDQRLLAN